jgi:hypothetical protein
MDMIRLHGRTDLASAVCDSASRSQAVDARDNATERRFADRHDVHLVGAHEKCALPIARALAVEARLQTAVADQAVLVPASTG